MLAVWFDLGIYQTIISKFQKFAKNSPIVKKSTSQLCNIILEACMQYETHPIKTVGEESFYSYFILYHYIKISKFAKNSKIVRSSKKSTTQVSDIILKACMQYENHPIEIVGEEAFYSYYILYHYFKIQKFAKNSKIV